MRKFGPKNMEDFLKFHNIWWFYVPPERQVKIVTYFM